MRRKIISLFILACLGLSMAGCSSNEADSPTSPSATVSGKTYAAPTTSQPSASSSSSGDASTPSPTPSTSAPSTDAGTDESGEVNIAEWGGDFTDVFTVVNSYSSLMWGTNNGSYTKDFLTRAAHVSTANQQERDKELVGGYDWNKDAQWLEETHADCEMKLWKDETWIIASRPATSDAVTLAVPSRLQCLTDGMSESAIAEAKLTWAKNRGLGYDGVTVTTFSLVRSGGTWLVDSWESLDTVVPNDY